MPDFIDRTLIKSVLEQKSKFPIIGITGPRQSGKTTLLKNAFNGYTYVSLENPDMRSFATDDPKGFFEKYKEHIILDEVQRVPELFSYLQTIVDQSNQMGQFILSGSQNFHLLNSITQTLAGRVALFKLFPLDFQELRNSEFLPDTYSEACFQGFYPAIFDRQINPTVFYSNYVQTYLERDVTELINIQDIKSFRTFISLCAARAGQLLNISAIANACGISQPTAKSWLSTLESSYIVFLMPPYYENFNKRLIKSPKLYFYDTGLLCYLLGIRNAGDMDENRMKGNIFENLIVAEYQKKNAHQCLHQDYYFWQDSNNHEVDLMTKKANSFDIFEIKATQTIISSLFKGMDYFETAATPNKVNKTLVYGGNEDQKRTKYSVLGWQNINP